MANRKAQQEAREKLCLFNMELLVTVCRELCGPHDLDVKEEWNWEKYIPTLQLKMTGSAVELRRSLRSLGVLKFLKMKAEKVPRSIGGNCAMVELCGNGIATPEFNAAMMEILRDMGEKKVRAVIPSASRRGVPHKKSSTRAAHPK